MTYYRPERRGGLYAFIWKYGWGAIIGTVAFLPLLITNFFQVFTLLIKPVSPRLYARINTQVALYIWGTWAWELHHIMGLQIVYHGDEIPKGESFLIIANHQGMTDIMALLCLGFRHHFVQYLKWMVKDTLKYVPAIGWGMLFLDCVFLKRNWEQDRQTILDTFARYRATPDPVCLVVFPEGTRRTPEKLQAAKNYAGKTGIEPFSEVLVPRAKGFTTAVQELSGKVHAVLSIAIDYRDPNDPRTMSAEAPSLMDVIRGDTRRISLHVKRTPTQNLPSQEKDLQKWLLDEFRQIDAVLKHPPPLA